MRQKWHSAQFFPIWHTSLILCHAAKLFNITGAGVKWYSVTHFLKHLILFSLHVSCPHKKTKTRKATGLKGWEHSTQGLDPRVENNWPKGREHSTQGSRTLDPNTPTQGSRTMDSTKLPNLSLASCDLLTPRSWSFQPLAPWTTCTNGHQNWLNRL